MELWCERAGYAMLSKSTASRKKSKKVDCPVKICFKRSKDGKYLELDPKKPFEAILEHKNHAIWMNRTGLEVLLKDVQGKEIEVQYKELEVQDKELEVQDKELEVQDKKLEESLGDMILEKNGNFIESDTTTTGNNYVVHTLLKEV